MKIIFLPVFYFLFTVHLSAQNWFANNPEWCAGTTDFFFDQSLYSVKTYIDGDTVIGNQNYKILKNLRQKIDFALEDTTYSEFTVGLLYEDEGKVYSRTAQGSDEIIYDFDLAIGDTIVLPYTECGAVKMILAANGFEDLNGTQVRYQDFLIEHEEELLGELVRVYEGIGLVFGPWYSTSGYGGFYPANNFFCGWVDPRTQFFNYSNDLFEYSVTEGECSFLQEIPTSLNPLQSLNKIEVYPNPCTNKFRLKSEENVDELFGRITDLNGIVLQNLKFINNQSTDISNLSPGLYFLELYTKDNFLGRKKIIKSSPY